MELIEVPFFLEIEFEILLDQYLKVEEATEESIRHVRMVPTSEEPTTN